jgi:hypothetical protein
VGICFTKQEYSKGDIGNRGAIHRQVGRIEEVLQTSYQRPSRTRGRAEEWQGSDSAVKKRDCSRSSPVHGAVDRPCHVGGLTRRVSGGGDDQRADPEKKGWERRTMS